MELYALIFSVLLLFSIFAGKAGYRFGVPILLLFIGVGMVAGSEGLGLAFNDYKLTQSIGTIALSIILFSGGLDTQYQEIRPVIKQGLVLATVGVVLTALISGAFIHTLIHLFFPTFEFSWLESFLLGSIMSSTDSASVFAILRARGLSLKHRLRPMLELESGSNDPMAYMLTIVLIQIITQQSQSVGEVLLHFGMQLVFGVICGLVLGKLFVKMINKINIQYDSLYPVLLLACAIFIFAFTHVIGGNGFLAVYLGGLIFGNHRFIHKRTSKDFFDGLAWLMQIVMFLTLGLLVNPSDLLPVIGVGLITAFGLIFISRPIAVFACLLPFKKMMNKDRVFVSWVGLRGAVPIIFAILPLVYKLPHANFMFNVVFFITLVSLLVQGTSLAWVARLLKLTKAGASRKKLNHFDFAFSDDVKSVMSEVKLSTDGIGKAKKVMDLPIPDNSLIVMVKRDRKYILPRGNTPLEVGDILLILTDDDESVQKTHQQLGSATPYVVEEADSIN